ncbi:MAG: hypothetical protein A2161_11480 [Candidatus Schekmanbacteria bacterium RBG_13_48_7]|uniref:NADH-quinone oxidoreductase subunit E n=1 Tax=Candidatus Schekmanbacteria bacterium RBG_13_48_7 TaxID=1817878 RepID=A0A1F7RXZ6_9BACT|nr:MAG: hypothetical protein A2161_11480 [Candidatus Schekmanbacteria bacterium RBG_13_48_7]
MEVTKQVLSESIKEKIKAEVSKYPSGEAALLPALYIVQDDLGYISPESVDGISELLKIPSSKITGVSTFYSMFNNKPVGKYLLQLCTSISCYLAGSDELFEYISKKLKINAGETTPDGKFTLMKVECLASCGTAPVLQINNDYHENMTIEKVDELLKKLS